MTSVRTGDWTYRCPMRSEGEGLSCHGVIAGRHEASASADDLRFECPKCGAAFPAPGGLLDLTGGLSDSEQRFLEEYHQVREQEGHAQDGLEALRMPWASSDHPLAGEWQVRARHFEFLRDRLLPRLRDNLKILDLGAGTAWLSYRLSLEGHRTCAVDLSAHPSLGLGAADAYLGEIDPMFPRIRARFTELPFESNQVDLIIFNASFHYTSSPHDALKESLRLLSERGAVLIMDSPLYNAEASGRQMVAERRERFFKEFGFESTALGSREFLDEAQLRQLADDLDIEWRRLRIQPSLAWRIRRWRDRRKKGRELARFDPLLAFPRGAPGPYRDQEEARS